MFGKWDKIFKSKFKNFKKIIIKNFLKDHRVFMTSVIAGLSFGGKWEIQDASLCLFFSFLSKLAELGLKSKNKVIFMNFININLQNFHIF